MFFGDGWVFFGDGTYILMFGVFFGENGFFALNCFFLDLERFPLKSVFPIPCFLVTVGCFLVTEGCFLLPNLVFW